MPNGNFIMYWEIGRAVCAFLTGMFYPLSVHLGTEIPNYEFYIKVLDLFALADMYSTVKLTLFPVIKTHLLPSYIRLHVGYYNKRGILVTHPKYTAIHYLSHAFFIDLLGVLPFPDILYLFKTLHTKYNDSVTHFHMIKSYLSYTKLLQMYRLPDAFIYFQRDPFKKKSVLL